MLKTIREDIQTVFRKDPAARNMLEVLTCYPGLHALWLYRLSHPLYKAKFYTLARLISHLARFLTGIEIHPGANIGKRFFIDHGMGVVVGETTDIGDDCLMYQGAVLGGTSLKKEKRHPTLGNEVVIGAGAVILGPVKIGDKARVGAGSVVVRDVPANASVVGVPGRVGMGFSPEEMSQLEHGQLPDPVAEGFQFVLKEIEHVEERLKKIESLEGVTEHIDEYFEKKKREIEEEFSDKKNPGT